MVKRNYGQFVLRLAHGDVVDRKRHERVRIRPVEVALGLRVGHHEHKVDGRTRTIYNESSIIRTLWHVYIGVARILSGGALFLTKKS